MAEALKDSGRIQAFKPIGSTDARILILGSMPSVASLAEQQYYAHPRNAFWPVLLATLKNEKVSFDLHTQTSYEKKLTLLKQHRIAVWDVLASCERPGSLDSAIKPGTTLCNNFVALLQSQKQLEKIIFNGKTAESLFKKHCVPELKSQAAERLNSLQLFCLPSTSPAMATLGLAEKHKQWQSALAETPAIHT